MVDNNLLKKEHDAKLDTSYLLGRVCTFFLFACCARMHKCRDAMDGKERPKEKGAASNAGRGLRGVCKRMFDAARPTSVSAKRICCFYLIL